MITVFLVGSMRLIFVNDDIPNSKLALYSFIGYPYTFRFLFAPILDCKYIKKIGQRKTWILPVLLLQAITALAFAFSYEYAKTSGWSGFFTVTGLGFVFMLLCGIQDTSIDGWMIKLLKKEHYALGYTM